MVEGGGVGGRTSLLLLEMVTGELVDGIVVEEGGGGRTSLLLFGIVTGELVDGIVVEGGVVGGRTLLLLILVFVLSGVDGIIDVGWL